MEVTKTRNKFAKDIKFNIYYGADFKVVKVCVLVGVGDDIDLEGVVGGVADGKAYTVYSY